MRRAASNFRASSSVAVSDNGANKAAFALSTVTLQPSSVLSLLRSAAPRLETASGRTHANLIGTAALACLEHSAAPRATSSPAASPSQSFEAETESFLRLAFDQRLLRRLEFDAADQALLYHAHLTLRLLYARRPASGGGVRPASQPCLPLDIAHACLRAHNASVQTQQGMFDVLARALRRAGVPYTYRTTLPQSGYLVWLLLQCRPRQAPRDGVSLFPAPNRASLEVAAEWNSLPNGAPTLGQRLYAANLALADGVRVEHLSHAERDAFLSAPMLINDDGYGARDAVRTSVGGEASPHDGTSKRAASTRDSFESLPDLLAYKARELMQP